MTLKQVLPLLRCPEYRLPLHKASSTLQCRKQHRFPIVKDIPMFHKENRHDQVDRNIFCVVADAEKLPFKTSSFDRITALALIEHLPNQLGHLNHYNFSMLRKLFGPFRLVPYDVSYIGHLVRLWQLAASNLLGSNWLWWQLEKLERKQSQKPTSVNFAVAFKKR